MCTFHSPVELKEEEREAQSAKLQELIRRGTPKDLREANWLMKRLAGHETHSQMDHEEAILKEISSAQEKAKLLEEMLDEIDSVDNKMVWDTIEVSEHYLQTGYLPTDITHGRNSYGDNVSTGLAHVNGMVQHVFDYYNAVKETTTSGPLISGNGAEIPKDGSSLCLARNFYFLKYGGAGLALVFAVFDSLTE
ncbi:gamma adaptin ear containing, arf binding protein [Ascosphaera atra]|nr:gamma adaptin ear containing, arf binding protein [Ascosphaera atra]